MPTPYPDLSGPVNSRRFRYSDSKATGHDTDRNIDEYCHSADCLNPPFKFKTAATALNLKGD